MADKKKKTKATPYKLKKLQLEKAKELGVNIKPSTNLKKKVDIFVKGKKVYSIGANGMNDYATYLEDKKVPKEEAELKRESYVKRHSKEPKMDKDGEFTKSFYADEILWGKKKKDVNKEAKQSKRVIKKIVKEIDEKEKKREKEIKKNKRK